MAVSEEHLNPSEQPEKGGRNAVLTVWGVLALLVLAAILFTLLMGRRPLAGSGNAASITVNVTNPKHSGYTCSITVGLSGSSKPVCA